MHIGMIGAGMIGGTLAHLFVRAGYAVVASNARGTESLAALVSELGSSARAATVEEAAAVGDLVVVAIPFGRYTALPTAQLAGKIVIDATNYYPQRDGVIEFAGRTSSELLAEALPNARVIKAFNTIHFQDLATQGNTALPIDQRRAIFIAGDDDDAKRVVSALIEAIGFAPVDTGSLHEGGFQQQPGSTIYNQPLSASQARKILGSAC
jgi:predicted dinucleotide-binding enzyme